jgi:hypothetical protein
MRIVLAGGNGMSDVLGAFDGVNDEHEIAHAFAAVGAQVAGPGIRSSRREEALIHL